MVSDIKNKQNTFMGSQQYSPNKVDNITKSRA